LRLAVVGWGRLGRARTTALQDAQDLMLAGVVRRAASLQTPAGREARGAPCVSHVRDLGAVGMALPCVPAEAAPGAAQELLQMRVARVLRAGPDGRALRDQREHTAHLPAWHRVVRPTAR
jgi:diaminopimelate dehydrogenase